MRYTYSVLLLLLSIAPFQYTFAQLKRTLIGNVTDSKTGETLIGASIKLTRGSTAITVTNNYGFYAFSAAEGEHDITVSFIGYKTVAQHLILSKDTRLNFVLEPGSQLDEVVISGIKSNDQVNIPQMGIQKINISEINNLPVLLGERDLIKALQLLPGIKLAGEGNSGFYIRGGATDQNLILLDEAPVYNASHLLGFFSTFNSDAIKDVTVYKEGMPAQYGGRLASVLDIKMNNGNSKKYTFEGGIGLISSRLKVEGPIVKDRGSFMISARRTYMDAFFKLSANPSIHKNTLYFYDLNAKANYKADDKNTFFLSGYFGRDKLNLVKLFGFDWGNATITLRWNHLYSSRLFSNTSLIYGKYSYFINNAIDDSNFEVNSFIRDFNFKQDFEYGISNQHKLKFGLNGIHHTIAPGVMTATAASSVNPVNYENRKGLELAAYVTDEWTAGEKLKFVYGLRLSSFSLMGPGNFKTYDNNGLIIEANPYGSGDLVKSYINLEPRFSASYKLGRNSSIKAAYTRNTQNIHLMSNSTSTSPTDLYIMNSNNVKPEIADQVSTGYFRNFKDEQFEFSAEIYYKRMQNQIEYRSGTDLREKDNAEADLLYGDGRAYGIELFLKKKYGKFNGWVGYTYSRTERQFDNLNGGKWFYAKQDRTHDLSVVSIYKPTDRWTFSAIFVYNTGNAVTYPSGKYQVNGKTVFYYSDKNTYRTPAYHHLDVSAILEGKKGRRFQSSWSFGIYNLYNRQNAFAINFKDDPNDLTKTQIVRTTLFGIIPSVTWNFKF